MLFITNIYFLLSELSLKHLKFSFILISFKMYYLSYVETKWMLIFKYISIFCAKVGHIFRKYGEHKRVPKNLNMGLKLMWTTKIQW